MGPTFKPADFKNAYAALTHLQARFEHESNRDSLTPHQLKMLRNVFEENDFMIGMFEVRQIAEHITKSSDGGPVVRLYATGMRIELPVETSVESFFGKPVLILADVHGKVWYDDPYDHAKQLAKAEQHLKRAIQRASEDKAS